MKHRLLVVLAMFGVMLTASLAEARPRRANDKWGAIAYSTSTGRYGIAYDYGTQAQAINSAVERCRVGDCKAVVWFKNSCGAFAQGNNAYGWGLGGARAEAEAKALAECRKHGGNCRVVAWSCTSR